MPEKMIVFVSLIWHTASDALLVHINKGHENIMKHILFLLAGVCILAQAAIACVVTDSPVGSWHYSQKSILNSSTAWYVSNTNDLAGCESLGYVTYGNEPGWFIGNSGYGIRVFETWIKSDADVTLLLVSGGDDGHSMFIDGKFIAGGGFGVNIYPTLELKAGIPRHVLLTSNNAIGGWHVNCRVRIGDDGELLPLEDIPGVSINAEDAVESGGLVAYYPFNGNANDESGNGYDGIVTDAVLTVDRYGNANSAYHFTRTSDRIDISSIPTLQEFTLCAWVRPDELLGTSIIGFDGQYAMIVGAGNDCHGTTKAGSYAAGIWTGGVRSRDVLLDDGEWHSIAWSRSLSGHQELYFDGILVASGDFNAGVIPTSGFGGFIGLYKRVDGVYSSLYSGDIDDVRFYDRVLSSNEVSSLYVEDVPLADKDSDGDGMPDEWEEAHKGIRIHDGIGDTVPADQENGDGTISFGGVAWQPWRVQWGISNGELASIPVARTGFNYGHGGHGRSAVINTHIGDLNWTDYEVELDVAPRGISPQFNPYGLSNRFYPISFRFRVNEAHESWNEKGWTCYSFSIGESGTVGLSRRHLSYCPGTVGWSSPEGNDYHLVGSGTDPMYNYADSLHVKFRVIGNRIIVWVDGIKCIDHNDTLVDGNNKPLMYGGLIISSLWEHMAAIKNLVIRKPGMMPDLPDADLDYDGDGVSNLEEYKGNSDPLDAGSIPDGFVAEPQPVLHYTFDNDDGKNVFDQSGNGNDGYLVGDVSYADSISGKAIRIDQSTEYVRCDSPGVNVDGWSGVTVSLWCYPEQYTTYGSLIGRKLPQSGSSSSASMGIEFGGIYNGRWATGTGFGASLKSGADGFTSVGVIAPSHGVDVSPYPPLNKWYNVVGVYDGTNISIYINGVLESCKLCKTSGAEMYDLAENVLYIGKSLGHRINWMDSYFHGLIDDVRIYNYGLKPNEVTKLYTDVITPVADLEKGLIAYYPFNGNAEDESGNGHDGAIAGAVEFVGAGENTSIKIPLDGASVIAPDTLFPAGDSPRSFSWWFKIDGFDIGRFAYMMSYGDVYPAINKRNSFGIDWRVGRDNVFFSQSGGVYLTAERIASNQWYHAVYTYGGNGEHRFYINGVLSSGHNELGGVLDTTKIGAFQIGGLAPGSSVTASIDEIYVYDRIITPSEIAALYAGFTPPNTSPCPQLVLHYTFDEDEGDVVTDHSGNGHTGVVHNASWVRDGIAGGAMDFNGETDYISTTRALNKDDDLTIAMWIYPYTTNQPSEGHRILYHQSPVPSSSQGYHGYGFYYNGARLAYDGGYPPSNGQIDATSPVVENQWQFVVITRSRGYVVHYLNGIPNGTGIADTFEWEEKGDLATVAARVYHSAPHQFYAGMIDDLRIYKGALSADEIMQLYKDTPTVGTHFVDSVNSANIPIASSTMTKDTSDVDGDGIPDAWELHFCGSVTGINPDADPDGDGHSNREEWIAGTDPTNSASVFAIAGVDDFGGERRLSWMSAAGHYYSVLFATNLFDEERILFSSIPATPPTNSIIIPQECPREGFFKIKVDE